MNKHFLFTPLLFLALYLSPAFAVPDQECGTDQPPELGISKDWIENEKLWAYSELGPTIKFNDVNIAVFVLWRREKSKTIITSCDPNSGEWMPFGTFLGYPVTTHTVLGNGQTVNSPIDWKRGYMKATVSSLLVQKDSENKPTNLIVSGHFSGIWPVMNEEKLSVNNMAYFNYFASRWVALSLGSESGEDKVVAAISFEETLFAVLHNKRGEREDQGYELDIFRRQNEEWERIGHTNHALDISLVSFIEEGDRLVLRASPSFEWFCDNGGMHFGDEHWERNRIPARKHSVSIGGD